LRRRKTITATATIPRKTTTTTTTTPISQAVKVESLARETEVEEAMFAVIELPVEAKEVIVEVPVAWGTGVDSTPPALQARVTLKVLSATISR